MILESARERKKNFVTLCKIKKDYNTNFKVTRMTTNLKKRKADIGALDLTWYKSQADADAACVGAMFSVKHGPYLFSKCENADDFIARYLARDEDLEIYEQLRRGSHAKLVFDIEQYFPSQPANTQEWLLTLLKIIQDALISEKVGHSLLCH